MSHHIRNYRMHEEFRYEHRHHNRYNERNFYQNSVWGGRPGYGFQGGYGNPFGYGYPEPPRKSFLEKVFPFAATAFAAYKIGQAPGNNFGEKTGNFLSGVGKFIGGIFGGGGSGGGFLGGIGKAISGLFGG